MKKFMFLLREDLAAASRMPAHEMEQTINRVTRWVEEIAKSGHFVSGDPLEGEMRLVTHDAVLSDGPFIDGKDGISGYFLVQANNLDQAAEIAATCPELGNVFGIEVRPVMELTADGHH